MFQVELRAGLEVYDLVGLFHYLRRLSGEEVVFRFADVVADDDCRFLVRLDLDDAGDEGRRLLAAGVHFDFAGDYRLGLGELGRTVNYFDFGYNVGGWLAGGSLNYLKTEEQTM